MVALFGAVLHGADRDLGTIRQDLHQRSAVMVLESAPAGIASVATRARTSFDGELSLISRSAKSRSGGLTPATVPGLAAAAAWWCLARPDRRMAPPLLRSPLAPRRAPPTTVV